MRIGSLFSGAGGLDLGVQRATGARVVWHAETDRHAATVLRHHWLGTPNLGDATLVDWSAAHEVDVVTAGFPCPPVSSAGKRRGAADPRWLWPQVARCVGALRPRFVFVENVAALVGFRAEFGAVLGDLAALGFDAEWCCVKASDVGAPHRRNRLFLLAADTERRELQRRGVDRIVAGAPGSAHRPWGERERDGDTASHCGPAPADPVGASSGSGHTQRGDGPAADRGRGAPQSGGRHQAPADADRSGREGQRRAQGRWAEPREPDPAWGPYAPAIARWEAIHGPAPDPVDRRGRLNPAFPEWMQGLPAGWVTGELAPGPWPSVPRTAQLRCIGNSVVPAAAEAAWGHLTGRYAEVAA